MDMLKSRFKKKTQGHQQTQKKISENEYFFFYLIFATKLFEPPVPVFNMRAGMKLVPPDESLQ